MRTVMTVILFCRALDGDRMAVYALVVAVAILVLMEVEP